MKLLDLPHFEDFRGSDDVKVLRHRGPWDLWGLREKGKLGPWQARQPRDVFGTARYLITFIAERGWYAKFVGVWKITSKRKKGKRWYYRTRELSGFKDLERRLIVSWREGALSWAQWLHRQGNKEVVELLPPNRVMDFPGYYNFALSYDELVKMVKHPDSNREWQTMLSSVPGVYVLLDRRSGKQYVGSACGSGGIWSRWQCYAKSPAGGNLLLRELLEKHPNRYKQFQFSILRVLEPGATKDGVLQEEVLAKRKLGSRATGLNCN